MSIQTKTQNKTDINNYFADNTSGSITAANLRTVATNIVDSYPDIFESTTTLTAAQFKALSGTPQTLITAQGANKYIHIHGIVYYLDFQTTAYTSGSNVRVYQENGSVSNLFETTSTKFQDNTKIYIPASPATDEDTVVPNGGVKITVAGSNFATGDSPVKVKVYYSVIDMS